MRVFQPKLDGIKVFEPKVFGDQRGFFLESWNQGRYQINGLNEHFVQDNFSRSAKGVLRGLHFQNPQGQGKLVTVLDGKVFDVAVDIRQDSPTFGQHFSIELCSEKMNQIYIPPGFAHGFCVLSDSALFHYKCTEYYDQATENSILWNDPALGVPWPVSSPTLSDRDASAKLLCDFSSEDLPRL